MLFQRREPAKLPEKVRIWLWPRRSWVRSTKYVTKRVLRITASPHAIAAGVAAGVFTSFTPFMGFHFLIAAILAYIIGGNMIASALGTFFGNFLSFPLIWIATFTTGRFILQGPDHHALGAANPVETLKELTDLDFMQEGFTGVFNKLADIWEPVLLPMFIGGIPLGIATGILFYTITRWTLTTFREARSQMILEKAEIIREKRENDKLKSGDAPSEEKGAIAKVKQKAQEIREKQTEKAADKLLSKRATGVEGVSIRK